MSQQPSNRGPPGDLCQGKPFNGLSPDMGSTNNHAPLSRGLPILQKCHTQPLLILPKVRQLQFLGGGSY